MYCKYCGRLNDEDAIFCKECGKPFEEQEDQKINEDITVNIGDAKAYKAKPGILGSKNGVEITDIIR